MSTVAALDCGTNSTRLLIADDDGREICREMRITRLGQGVDATGVLDPAAMERTFSVLEQYAGLMQLHHVTRSRLVATSAARDAANGPEFLERARVLTGAAAELLSGDEEAELSFRGATADLEENELTTMILDIGGGSTEIAAPIGGRLVAHSMQVGCVRVSERTLGAGVVTSEAAAAARRMIDEALDGAFASEPLFSQIKGRVRLVGLAGTVSTLAQLDVGRAVYERDVVHHHHLSLDDVVRWRNNLGAETTEQRLRRAGMVKGREDVLVGGLFILESVMRRFEVDELITSESDILDGLVASMLVPGTP